MKKLLLNLLMLPLSSIPLYAQGFDDSTGREAVGQFYEYEGEMKPRAEDAVEKVDPESVTHHPYHDGAPDQKTVDDNHKFDKEVIMNEETYDTFDECMQYEDIGICLTIDPATGQVFPTPFVRYWAPFQKGEEVPEAFRTGYKTKEQIKPIKEKALEHYYDEFIPKVVAPSEINFGVQTTAKYLNKVLDLDEPLEPEEVTEDDIDQDVIDATKDAITEYGENQFGEAWMPQDGYVFNDYHLMEGISKPELEPRVPNSMEESEGVWKKIPYDPSRRYHYCHDRSIAVGEWYGEFPENRYFSRVSVASLTKFSSEMGEFQNNPLTCFDFNRKSRSGKSPDEIANVDRLGGGSGAPCQGVNQGLWVPVTYRTHTMYPMTAAALGLTKSKIAFAVSPSNFHDITPKDDKAQWIRNERMDGINSVDGRPDVITEKVKRCDKLAKWVLQYEKGNLKISPDEKMDYWSVIAHWRKIRCCVEGGVPVFLKPGYPDETLVPIPR